MNCYFDLVESCPRIVATRNKQQARRTISFQLMCMVRCTFWSWLNLPLYSCFCCCVLFCFFPICKRNVISNSFSKQRWFCVVKEDVLHITLQLFNVKSIEPFTLRRTSGFGRVCLVPSRPACTWLIRYSICPVPRYCIREWQLVKCTRNFRDLVLQRELIAWKYWYPKRVSRKAERCLWTGSPVDTIHFLKYIYPS